MLDRRQFLTLAGSAALGAGVSGGTPSQLETYLRRAEAFGYSGAVLVDGPQRLLAGFGLADRARGVRYTPDTAFDIGSITKHMTAALLLLLERDGILKMQSTLGDFFPDMPADKRAITIHQILTHSSGLPRIVGKESDVLTRDQLIAAVGAAPMQSAPGTTFLYSNIGYKLAAAIAEVASGIPYRALMRKRIFDPAGMAQTGFYGDAERWSRERVAQGYYETIPTGSAVEGTISWNDLGSGHVVSTMRDLERWNRALTDRRILDDALYAKMFTAYVASDNPPFYYGYGWYVYPPDGKRLAYHPGFDRNFGTEFRRYNDGALTIVVTSNVGFLGGEGLQDPVINGVAAVVRHRPASMPPATRIAREMRALGRYRIDSDNGIVVSQRDGVAYLTPYGRRACAVVYFPNGGSARVADADRMSAEMLASRHRIPELQSLSIAAYTIRGTGSYPFDDTLLRTYADVTVPQGRNVLTLGYKNGKLFDVTTWPVGADPGALRLVPGDGNAWHTYNLFAGATGTVRFAGNRIEIEDRYGTLSGAL